MLLERPRVTVADEVLQRGTGATLVTTGAFSGTNALKFTADASKAVGQPSTTETIPLNAYPVVNFAIKGDSGVVSSALCFKIDNRTDPEIADDWYCTVVGTTWTTPYTQSRIANSTISTTWAYYSVNLWSLVSGNSHFGTSLDDYAVTGMTVQSSGSGSPNTNKFVYLDAGRS